jgi:hypothetical protein
MNAPTKISEEKQGYKRTAGNSRTKKCNIWEKKIYDIGIRADWIVQKRVAMNLKRDQ